MFERELRADLCVVGAGMAGICVAIAAARRGVKVILVHDRPVVGGNASGEVRMWIRGASTAFPEYREGGILEEIASDNIRYNPSMNFSLWDGVLYNKVTAEKNICLLLNTSCTSATEKDGKIVGISAWQLTSYTRFRIYADYFADCTGDCIFAESTAAEYRQGRESRAEFGESFAPEKSDRKTMGNSCLLQARETDSPVKFTPPPFAYKFSDEEFAHRLDVSRRAIELRYQNFWWIELGGEGDALRDAEKYNRELIARCFGVWDYIKNSGRFAAENWELDWVGFLAGKRETRRYAGDYTLTQNDILSARPFPDEVAYGGWSMDDHNPLGMATKEPSNIHYPVENPYPIPYRCLYSKNISNLFFAGRNISVTHMALSSTRVMATCAAAGQAAGTACALAVKYGISPREVGGHMPELQQALREDDCFLLHTPRRASRAMRAAKTSLPPDRFEKMLDGTERNIGGEDKAFALKAGESATFLFPEATPCAGIRIVFDDDLEGKRYGDEAWHLKLYPNCCSRPKGAPEAFFPPWLAKKFRVFVFENEKKRRVFETEDNFYRMVKLSACGSISGVELTVDETHGGAPARIFSVDILPEERSEK